MARRAKTHQRITGQALQREGGRDGMTEPQSYLIQTVPSEEVTINELTHIITRIY